MESKENQDIVTNLFNREPLWCNNHKDSSILYTAVRVVRNFVGFNYPDKMKKVELYQLEEIVEKALSNLGDDLNYTKVDLETLDEVRHLILKERKILPQIKSSERSKLRLYVFDDYKTFLLLNYKDHISIVSYSSKKTTKNSGQPIKMILECFNEEQFQSNSNLGYLSSSLNFLGSGLKTYSSFILPYQREVNQLRNSVSGFGSNGYISIRANQFTTDNEDIILTTNKESLTVSPEQTIKNQLMFEKAILDVEKGCKEQVLNEDGRLDLIADQTLKMLERENLSYKSFIEIFFKLIILKDCGYQHISIPRLKNYYYSLTRGGISHKEGVNLSTLDCDRLRISLLKSLIVR